MAPPVKAAVNALGYDRGCMPLYLDDSWTRQGGRGPISGHAGPMPERAGYSTLSTRHRQGTARTHDPAPREMAETYGPIQPNTPEQSGLCGPVSYAAPGGAVVGRPRRASGLLRG